MIASCLPSFLPSGPPSFLPSFLLPLPAFLAAFLHSCMPAALPARPFIPILQPSWPGGSHVLVSLSVSVTGCSAFWASLRTPQVAVSKGVTFVIEQPASSVLKFDRRLSRILKACEASQVFTWMGAFGADTPKVLPARPSVSGRGLAQRLLRRRPRIGPACSTALDSSGRMLAGATMRPGLRLSR